MFDLITDASEIRNAQQHLARKLINAASPSVACRVGYRGDNMRIKAHWIEHSGIWFAAKPLKDETSSSLLEWIWSRATNSWQPPVYNMCHPSARLNQRTA